MTRPPGPNPIDGFLADSDIRERHEIKVRAPAHLVFETARGISLRHIPVVRWIFWLRAKILGAKGAGTDWSRGFFDEALSMGWGVLVEEKGRCLVAGAACQPWQPDVVFTPIPADHFMAYHEPDRVKIVWMIRCEELGNGVSLFSTETRAVGTDPGARERFRRYWRKFGAGIILIRWLLLPAIRREAERRYRALGDTVRAAQGDR